MSRWEKLLLLVGLAAVDVWLLSNAQRVIYQGWQEWVFDRQSHGEPADFQAFLDEKKYVIELRLGMIAPQPPRMTVATPAPPAGAAPGAGKPTPPAGSHIAGPNEVVGRLSIPRLRVSEMVRQGVGEDTLRVALGHIPGTPLPGQAGNVGIAGHRDTLFRALGRIHKDDLIVFETVSAKYEYRVRSTEIVSPRKVSVLDSKASPELTLVTCYPFHYVGSAPQRFIVKARQKAGTT